MKHPTPPAPVTRKATSAADLYSFDLAANCTLVKLSASQFSGRKKDEALAADVARDNNGETDGFETFLKVLPDDTRKAIQKIVTEARTLYKLHTTPWDTGWALVNNTIYEKLRSDLEEFGVRFMEAVRVEVLDKRDELAALAETRLGNRAYLHPFPSLEELKEEYLFSVQTMPIPNPKDLRLKHVSPEVAQKIEAETTQLLNEKLKGAMTTVVSRIRSVVERVFDTLNDDNKIFRDSMIANVRDLCAVIPELNLTNDRYIAQVADEIMTTLGSVDCQKIRENPEERKAVAVKAGGLLARLKNVKISDNM